MSGFVKEFSGASGTTVTQVQVAVPSAVPVNNSLVAAVVTLSSLTPVGTISAADTKGNTWTFLYSDAVGSDNTSTHTIYATITNALEATDTITFTYSQSATRSAISVAEFNDVLVPDVQAGGDNGGNSSSTLVTDATAATSQADELVFVSPP